MSVWKDYRRETRQARQWVLSYGRKHLTRKEYEELGHWGRLLRKRELACQRKRKWRKLHPPPPREVPFEYEEWVHETDPVADELFEANKLDEFKAYVKHRFEEDCAKEKALDAELARLGKGKREFDADIPVFGLFLAWLRECYPQTFTECITRLKTSYNGYKGELFNERQEFKRWFCYDSQGDDQGAFLSRDEFVKWVQENRPGATGTLNTLLKLSPKKMEPILMTEPFKQDMDIG